jgi:glycerophosphoryl diester phosphodiesterase
MSFKSFFFWLNVLAASCLFSGCQKAVVQQVTNLNGNRIEVVGHGGIGFQSLSNQLPHNSFTSIMKVIEAYQADGVEIDIQLSSDGLLFMYASERLETMTDGSGFLPDLPSEELLQMRYRNDFLINTFSEEFLCPLDSVLDIFSQRNNPPKVFLDIKTLGRSFGDLSYKEYNERMTDAISEVIDRYDAETWIYVESADAEFLLELKTRHDRLQLFFDAGTFPEDIHKAAQHGFYGIICSNDDVEAEDVALAHSHGVKVSIYGVKSRSGHLGTIAKNPDYIQTDNVSLLQQILFVYN